MNMEIGKVEFKGHSGINTDGNHYDKNVDNKIHLIGADDNYTACGIAMDEYNYLETDKKITCNECKAFQAWAKAVAKLK